MRQNRFKIGDLVITRYARTICLVVGEHGGNLTLIVLDNMSVWLWPDGFLSGLTKIG